MVDTNPPDDPRQSPAPQPPVPDAPTPGPQSQPKRRRRWPWVVLGVLLFLLLLLILLPSIVSMRWARSMVIGTVDKRINGHVELQGFSIGWRSGARVDGLVIYDESNRQILQLPHLASGLNLWNILRGHYDIGRTEVDGLDVLVSREADGSLNWERIARSSPVAQSGENQKPAGAAQAKEQKKLPEIRGELVLNNCNVSYEDRSRGQAAHVRSIQGDLKIPDINQPITNALSAQVQIAQTVSPSGAPAPSGSTGSLSANGTIAVVRGSVVAMDAADVDETVDLNGVELGAVTALLPAGEQPQLAGRSDGHVVLKLTNGSAGSLQVHIGLANVGLAEGRGAAVRQVLNGYNLSVDTAAAFSSGPQGRDLKVTQLKVGDNQGIFSLDKTSAQGLVVTLPSSSPPAARGGIKLGADLARLNSVLHAFQAPQIAADDQNSMRLRSGRLDGSVELAQASNDQVELTGNFGLTQLTVGDAAAAPISNQKVELALKVLANHDLSIVQPQADATGDLLTVHLSDTVLNAARGAGGNPLSAFERVMSAKARVAVPSLPNLQIVLRAFTPKPVVREQPVAMLAAANPKLPAGALPSGSANPAEPAPVDLTSGSATITLEVGHDGQKLTVTPAAALKNLGFRRGQVGDTLGDIELNASAAITPASTTQNPTASLLDQIAELAVTKLHLSAPAVGNLDIGLVDQPIDVKDPGGLSQLFSPPAGSASHATAAAASGRILVRGDPGPLMALKDAWEGHQSEQHYGGGYAIDEQFATSDAGVIVASGRADLNELTIDQQPYPEKAFRLFNNLALDGRQKTLSIDNLAAQATSSNGINLVVKGKVLDLGDRQQLDKWLVADLGYDAAQLWKMILPLMSKESQQKYKDVQVSGKYQKQFVAVGAYPAGGTFNEAIQQLLVHGDVQLDLFEGQGVTLKQLVVPVDFRSGQLFIRYADKPAGQNYAPPASFNGGTLDLGGCMVDLRDPHSRLTTPRDLRVVQNATLNPVFAAWSLGDYLNNPVFVGAKQASGVLNVTIVQCDRLPLDSSVTDAGDGKAVLNVSIQGLHVGNPTLQKMTDVAGIELASIQGNVEQYQVTIEHGIATQNMTVTVGKGERPLKLSGAVRLKDREMLPVTLDFPLKLFGIKKVPQEVQQFVPNQDVAIAMFGKPESPRLELKGFDLRQIVQQATQKAIQQNLLRNLPGGNPSTQPSDQNPLNEIENLIRGARKDKSQKKPPTTRQ